MGRGLSWRRCYVLVSQLPPESALCRALGHNWQVGDYLAAAAVDCLQAANWQRGGDSSQPRPEPLPRPGHEEQTAARQSVILARAEAFRARQQQQDGGPA